jgi:hypothetical protein
MNNFSMVANDKVAFYRLKKEMEHLGLQLIYERSLREKYEEDSNKLHFIKIERDQLNVEKVYLERNLKQLIEQYKNEVEESLTMQNNIELSAYKNELEDKYILIE